MNAEIPIDAEDEMAKGLRAILDTNIKPEMRREGLPRAVAAVTPAPPSKATDRGSMEALHGQMSRYNELKSALSENVSKTQRELKAAFEVEIMRITHDFDTRVAETLERLERDRMTELRRARDAYHAKQASIDLLSQHLD